jgi:hypothetical protein
MKITYGLYRICLVNSASQFYRTQRRARTIARLPVEETMALEFSFRQQLLPFLRKAVINMQADTEGRQNELQPELTIRADYRWRLLRELRKKQPVRMSCRVDFDVYQSVVTALAGRRLF